MLEKAREKIAAHGLGNVRGLSVQDACHLGFASGRFDAVVARGDYALGKPAPDPFLRAAERLGVAAGGCLALEDSPHGVRSAAAAGMMVVMVPDLLPASDAERDVCAFIAEDLHNVSRAIRVVLAD